MGGLGTYHSIPKEEIEGLLRFIADTTLMEINGKWSWNFYDIVDFLKEKDLIRDTRRNSDRVVDPIVYTLVQKAREYRITFRGLFLIKLLDKKIIQI